ncbi:MAG: hypothetical protein MUE96_05210 [Bacteroidia bacterium]|nr:hypothetical protein [Bacteroidia bacterium]
MKKISSFLLLISFLLNVYAQGHLMSSNEFFWWKYNSTYFKQHQIKEITETQTKKGKQFIIGTGSYNRVGQQIQFTQYKNNKPQRTTINEYTNDSTLTRMIYIVKGDTIRDHTYQLNNNGQIEAVVCKGKNGKLLNTQLFSYNAAGKMIKSETITAKGKPSFKVESDYDSLGNRTESRYYNRRSKLYRRYTYACNVAGEQIKSTVENHQICKSYNQYPDGSFVVVSENRDQKSRVVRVVSSYTADSLLTKLEKFDYTGKLESLTTLEYDDAKNIIRYQFKDKQRSKFTKSYARKYEAQSNIVLSTLQYNQKDKLVLVTSYQYQYHK